MTRERMALAVMVAGLALLTTGHGPSGAQDASGMSFFITGSGPGNGADLGGLSGADAHCSALAEAVGEGGRNWRAYLSAGPSEDSTVVHARDRIGPGPWFNAAGVRLRRTWKNSTAKTT